MVLKRLMGTEQVMNLFCAQPIVRELRELPSLTFYESADPAIPVDPVVDTVDDVSTEETTPTDTPSDTAPQETPPLSGSGSIKPQPSNTTTKTTQARFVCIIPSNL